MKVCSSCKVKKNLEEFYKDKSREDGFYPQCKSCRRIYYKKYYTKNKERIKKETKNYKEKNIERYKELISNWRKENFERNANLKREWVKKNKEKLSFSNINTQNKRRVKQKYTDINEEFLVELKKNTKVCFLCNTILNNIKNHPSQYNLDHIVPLNMGGEHIKNNVRYICANCNKRRPRDGSDIKMKVII